MIKLSQRLLLHHENRKKLNNKNKKQNPRRGDEPLKSDIECSEIMESTRNRDEGEEGGRRQQEYRTRM